MIEAYSHIHVKHLLRKDSLAWPHNLTLSRLVARSLRRKDKSLFQLDISNPDLCWLGVLIPLCMKSEDVVILLTERQRRRLFNVELPRLKAEGLNLPSWEDSQPPPGKQLWLLDYVQFFDAYNNGYLQSKQLIVPEAELFSNRLREAMAIKISPSHWDVLRRAHPCAASELIQLYERLSRRLFTQATRIDDQVSMDFSEVLALKDLLGVLDKSPLPWPHVLQALGQNWASWAELDHKMLDWHWHLQPLEPLKILQKLFCENPFVMLSGTSQKNLFLNNLESLPLALNVQVKLGDRLHQEPIKLFIPRRQPLPNTEYFSEYLLDQSRRLILGRSGITIILLDDPHLLRQLTSALAAEFGKRVVLESTSPESNGVICCSSFWWMNRKEQLPTPEQLIIGMLPFPSLELPLNAARVKACKQQGLDWFRDLLLPELLGLLPRLVEPIRKSHGRIAILDGRIRSRSWGKNILNTLEPWSPLDRLLPD